jgi:hypothetical protein
MFRPDLTAVADAAASLGWDGAPVEIRMCGQDAWVIASLTPNESVSEHGMPMRIAGALVAGDIRSKPTERASLFAGYCPRAVLIPDGRGVLPVQIDAAVLDQGVVVFANDSLYKLSDAGPTVPGGADVNTSARREFAERVYAGLTARNCVDGTGD